MYTERDIDLTRHASARDIYRGCIRLEYLQSVCVGVCCDRRRLAKGTNSWGFPSGGAV